MSVRLAAPAVKARDLRVRIKELGYEKAVVEILEQLLEEHSANRQYISNLTDITSRLVDAFERCTQVADGMRLQIDSIRRAQKENDAGG